MQFGETVTVLVGKGGCEHKFTVHTCAINGRSRFLTTACADRWTSSGAKKDYIDLSDEIPFIFDLYLFCIYVEAVRHGDIDEFIMRDATDDDWYSWRDEKIKRLVHVYLLADKLGDSRTMNMAMDDLVEELVVWETIPLMQHVNLAYEHSPETSQLRKLLTDKLACHRLHLLEDSHILTAELVHGIQAE